MQVSHLKTAFNKAVWGNNLDSNIFFSYIIPTIGRRSLDIAVNSVLKQNFHRAKFEVIVVNDSGQSLPITNWYASPCVRVINTHKSERSFARNSGAAIAHGTYIAFLDDDDWILPGALESFWQLANQYPDAAWLYGGIRIVDEWDKVLGEINSRLTGNCFSQIMGGAWAPLQASIIQSRAFFEIGGFNPLISGTEDEDLCRRIASRGDFANTAEVIACLYRGQTWNTSTNYKRAPEDTKYSRDLIFSEPKSFQRLRSSVDSSYWSGRVLRVYLSTLVWSLRKKRFFTALSRLLYSTALLGLSIKYIFSGDYWAGLSADHVPETLHFVMRDAERRIKRSW
ncbi:MAG TPA: glycosyltransferase family A protein [Anaerolineales bacterium]|nr:glycosyltransferase family A protein [Anaerolineales bacterium]